MQNGFLNGTLRKVWRTRGKVRDMECELTTHMLALSGKGVIRAEAHRQAMMAMIDTGPAQNANPALWGAFVVVGEGGIRHAR